VELAENSRINIEGEGIFTIGENALIYGINSTDTAILVKGGEFTVGQDVVFQDLPGGIYLDIHRNAHGLPLLDLTTTYLLSHVTFHNAPLTHGGNVLHAHRCTFNSGSDSKSYLGVFKLDSCVFYESSFWANHTIPTSGIFKIPKGVGVSIVNSQFSGDGTTTAIQLSNLWSFEIKNNTISEYETGISLSGSGLTQLPSSICEIYNNEVSNCNIGMQLFNSASSFHINHIHAHNQGIKLFNNSYTLFDNSYHSENQTIENCKELGVYASENSFPTIFRYNTITYEGIIVYPNYYPLFWWDVLPPYPEKQDIRYNCWGKGFDPTNYLFPSGILGWSPDWCSKSRTPIRENDEILYQTGLDLFANEDYSNAEGTFKAMIETYPDSRFAIAAMHELFALEHYTNHAFAGLQTYFASFTAADSNLFNVADFLSTRCYVKEREWQPAIDWYENRIENPPRYQDSVFAVIDLGDIHLMMEGDTAGGGKSGGQWLYRLLDIKPKSKQQYEENKAELLATLPQIKKPRNTENGTWRTEHGTAQKGVLGECIPNPTNGNATITYQIFTEGTIEIGIYNVSGQLLKSFPQGALEKGGHEAKISLFGVSSGVYHYVLYVNGERTDAKKLVVN
jgi:tetratricopeptide (TPR) repeat protein